MKNSVRMELLAGARSEHELDSLIRVLDRAVDLPMRPEDYEDAAGMSARRNRAKPD